MRKAAENADGLGIRRVRGPARRRRETVGAEDSGWLRVRRASRLGAFTLIVLGLAATSALVGPTGADASEDDGVWESRPALTSLEEVAPGPVLQAGRLCDSSDVAQFGDVGEGDYGADYILCMRALGLSFGTGAGNYGPDLQLTRAQMAAFLVRLWRDVLNKDCPSGGTPFTDVAGSFSRGEHCLFVQLGNHHGQDRYHL